jgi:cellobiose phosphorylase
MAHQCRSWKFINQAGEICLEGPDCDRELYFPLANEAGMLSSITPMLHGDIKTGQHSFFSMPVSVMDLHNTRSSRNFWLNIEGYGAWSAIGNSARQIARNFPDQTEMVTLKAGFLWHQVIRENRELGIMAETTNFVPVNEDTVELMRVTITNTGSEVMKFIPYAAIPIFGRSADNLRDHRHVTSLLHRIKAAAYGVHVCPVFHFDERGHQVNRTAYGLVGADGAGTTPLGFHPVIGEFIGTGGTLEWPETVVSGGNHWTAAGAIIEGEEALGGIRFQESVLEPGRFQSFILALFIADSNVNPDDYAAKYCSEKHFAAYLGENQQFWEKRLSKLEFRSGATEFDRWLKWVTLQPMLRKIYGCSFLPHHDYGKGGRGWRDLWQDCLALLIINPSSVRSLLLNNLAGVRIDGSNATIIGKEPGEFIADRNNISRVWMDHGAWPSFTVKLYIEQSGDLGFLLEEQTYFKDGQICRSKCYDSLWNPGDGTLLLQENGQVYRGTVLEHILLQLVVQFFNVGAHNHIRLEGADWNDALDMAAEHGESVAFSAFYAYNLAEFSKILRVLSEKSGISRIELADEIILLLDTFHDKIDYEQAGEKQYRLAQYFQKCQHRISGRKAKVLLSNVADDLARKAEWIIAHIRTWEWVRADDAHSWYNGYYNNDGEAIEGSNSSGPRMTLTGQVFTILAGVAANDQVAAIIQSVNRHLKDPLTGGIRLNTDFVGIQPNLGRGFAFAYGHKENGSVFCHMTVMYAYALYQRGFVREGFQVLQNLYHLGINFAKSRIYPGIPEYFDNKGRGMYHYLTGSASWFLFTFLTEIYGVKGAFGDLILEPKLLLEQFDSAGRAGVTTLFGGRQLRITYINVNRLEYGSYRIRRVLLDGKVVAGETGLSRIILAKEILSELGSESHNIDVELGENMERHTIRA